MEHNAYLLEMKQIDKIFPGTHALDHVNLSLKKGEVHALIGQNGSGKSTLMSILSGGLRMDSGEIFKNGKKISVTSPIIALNKGITMIHQELKLFPELTVAENILFGNYPQKRGSIDWQELFRQADEAIQMLNSNIDVKVKVKELSVPQQQIVEIMRAIVRNSEILIMDEPTASLSDQEAQILFNVIHELKSRGVTIVFISHRLDEVLSISDRITVLRDGLLVGVFERHEITSKDQLVQLMINMKTNIEPEHEVHHLDETILTMKNISMGKKLHNINLELKQGEVLGIAGLMGSGRTELLKTIFGAYTPTEGNILVGGGEYSKLTPKQAVRLGIAYMSEDRKSEGLLLKMSIQDNEIYASFDKFSRFGIINNRKRKQAVDEMTEKLRLKAGSVKDEASSLSGGNQQKVVIAKWLCAQSSIILMDEPTRGIDVGAKSEIYKLVRELAKEGKSIIFVSSELEEIQMVCDRILVICDGRIRKELPAKSTVQEIMKYAV